MSRKRAPTLARGPRSPACFAKRASQVSAATGAEASPLSGPKPCPTACPGSSDPTSVPTSTAAFKRAVPGRRRAVAAARIWGV